MVSLSCNEHTVYKKLFLVVVVELDIHATMIVRRFFFKNKKMLISKQKMINGIGHSLRSFI